MQPNTTHQRTDDDSTAGLDRMAPTQHDPLFTKDSPALGSPGRHSPLLLKRSAKRSMTGLMVALLLFATLATIAFLALRQQRPNDGRTRGLQGETTPNVGPTDKSR